MYTLNDVGPYRSVNGEQILMTDAERQATADEWNGNLQSIAVPSQVTMRQARIALFNAGLLSNVDAAIASLPEPQQTVAKISWDYSSTVERNNPVFIQLATALGLNSAQIDQFMINASKL